MVAPGKVLVYGNGHESITARLYNFDIAKHDVKMEHRTWLSANVTGFLKNGGSMIVIGMASRTDTDVFNIALSRRRADAVVRFLRSQVPKRFRVSVILAAGESGARYAGIQDGVENENWRGVVIAAWNKPEPPPPPPPPPPRPVAFVQRLVLAKFMTQVRINDSGATAGDGPLAPRLADVVMDRNFRKYEAHNGVRERAAKPENSQLVQVTFYFDDRGSYNVGTLRSGVDIHNCTVDYTWAKRHRVVRTILVDYYSPGKSSRSGSQPNVYQLKNVQRDLWLSNPVEAFFRTRNGEWNLNRVSFDDYQKHQWSEPNAWEYWR